MVFCLCEPCMLTHPSSPFDETCALFSSTVAVAVSYLDIYLSRRHVDRLAQLLAMVCIFVASKFHEVDPISIVELQTLAEGDTRSSRSGSSSSICCRPCPGT